MTEFDSVDGLDRYLEKDEDGTIHLDVAAAENAGYSEKIITALQEQISDMNTLVMEGNAYIDNTFTVTVYFASARARGVNKVVTHWYGLTEVYMDSDKAQELINELSAVGDVGTIGGLFAGGTLSKVVGLIGAGVMINRWQVEQAAAPGRGIIMNSQLDFMTQVQSVWFVSQ